MAQSSGRTGAIVVAALLVIGAGLVALHYKTKQRLANETIAIVQANAGNATPATGKTPAMAMPPTSGSGVPVLAPPPSPTPISVASLGTISPADMPKMVTLLKAETVVYRKGATFVTKADAPLFFSNQYVRNARKGEQYEILDYNPVERKVFLKAQAQNGQVIALNALDLHGTVAKSEPVPANSQIQCIGVSGESVEIAYQGDRILVPAGDTDFVQQVQKLRGGGLSGP
jgi:hypothetical protein